MKDYPEAFWGAVYIFLACATASIAIFHKSSDTAAVVTLATGIITGTFGYLKGRSDGIRAALQTTPPTTTVTLDPQPKE